MSNRDEAAVCGLYCGICEYRSENPCTGCMSVEGQPGWVKQLDLEVCPLYDCCVNENHLQHCGLCDDLPCQLFLESHDPSLNPQEAKKDIENRIDTLKMRKEIGTADWLMRQSKDNPAG